MAHQKAPPEIRRGVHWTTCEGRSGAASFGQPIDGEQPLIRPEIGLEKSGPVREHLPGSAPTQLYRELLHSAWC